MSIFHHQHLEFGRRGLRRRSFLHAVSAGAVAAGTLNFRDLMSLQAAAEQAMVVNDQHSYRTLSVRPALFLHQL